MTEYDGNVALEKVKGLILRSRRVGTNVTMYTGPELGRLAEGVGQRNIFGGYNWDSRVRNRSAKYTVVLLDGGVSTDNLLPEQVETLSTMSKEFTRIFGGVYEEKQHIGHANQLPIDLVH